MFGVTGAGLSTVRYYSNNKKAPRRGLDAWDRQSWPSSFIISGSLLTTCSTVMDRDFRLTGEWRGQSDSAVAPVGFEVNNPWRVCRFLSYASTTVKLCSDGGKDCLIAYASAIFTVHIVLARVAAYNPQSARQKLASSIFYPPGCTQQSNIDSNSITSPPMMA